MPQHVQELENIYSRQEANLGDVTMQILTFNYMLFPSFNDINLMIPHMQAENENF